MLVQQHSPAVERRQAPQGNHANQSRKGKRGAIQGASQPSTLTAELQAPQASTQMVSDMKNDNRTTVMIRNLPNNYTRVMLQEMLDNEGFAGVFDFLYLPTDFRNLAGFGYAFVNFTRHADAIRAKQHFQDFNRWKVPSRKVCDVVWSGSHQGLRAHVERYRNSPVMHENVPDEYKPVIFSNGVRAAFPPPTKTIRPPRMRKDTGKVGAEADDGHLD